MSANVSVDKSIDVSVGVAVGASVNVSVGDLRPAVLCRRCCRGDCGGITVERAIALVPRASKVF